MKRLILIVLTLAGALCAQTRLVTISWTLSITSDVTGYTIATAPFAAGPFTQIGCTGTVVGSTCATGSTASTTFYEDTETVGTTVYYQVEAVAPACTSTTPVTQPCGVSVPVPLTVPIPPKPAVPGSIIVIIQ